MKRVREETPTEEVNKKICVDNSNYNISLKEKVIENMLYHINQIPDRDVAEDIMIYNFIKNQTNYHYNNNHEHLFSSFYSIKYTGTPLLNITLLPILWTENTKIIEDINNMLLYSTPSLHDKTTNLNYCYQIIFRKDNERHWYDFKLYQFGEYPYQTDNYTIFSGSWDSVHKAALHELVRCFVVVNETDIFKYLEMVISNLKHHRLVNEIYRQAQTMLANNAPNISYATGATGAYYK